MNAATATSRDSDVATPEFGYENRMNTSTVDEINRNVREQRDRLEPFFREVGKVIVGQRTLIERLLIGLLTDGHILLEGVPGLAKTLAIRTMAKTLRLDFKRIQFTPDLLPADVVGTQIYNPRSGEFSVKKGPLFANVVLADEINRAPAKVQSALLEAMQEKQVTIGDTTFPLPLPFLVLATQNPIEQEGTYPLPEAQVDRFMLKVHLDYPSKAEELAILERMGGIEPKLHVDPVLELDDLWALRETVDSVYVDEKINNYIVDIVRATRRPADYGVDLAGMIQFGASPRALIAMARAGRAQAFLDGRGYVTPQDIKSSVIDVLRHRVIVSYEAEAEELKAEDLIRRVVEKLPVP
jgi:MoxR-like ATPase